MIDTTEKTKVRGEFSTKLNEIFDNAQIKLTGRPAILEAELGINRSKAWRWLENNEVPGSKNLLEVLKWVSSKGNFNIPVGELMEYLVDDSIQSPFTRPKPKVNHMAKMEIYNRVAIEANKMNLNLKTLSDDKRDEVFEALFVEYNINQQIPSDNLISSLLKIVK